MRIRTAFAVAVVLGGVLCSLLPVAATGGDDYVQVYNGAPTLCIWGNLHVVDAATVSGYAQTESDSGASCNTHYNVGAGILRSRADSYSSLYPSAQLCLTGPAWLTNSSTTWQVKNSFNFAVYTFGCGVFTPTHFYVLGLHQWNVYGVGWSPSQPSGTLVAVF